MQTLYNILFYFLGLAVGFLLGYSYLKNKKESVQNILTSLGTSIENTTPTTQEVYSNDKISNEGVGIVYRPTAEELEIMNEPQAVKDAKLAMEETIRNTPEPEI